MKGTWETTGGGGGGAGTALLALLGVVLAAAVIGPVVRAVVSLMETVLVVTAALVGLGIVAGIVLVVVRLHRGHTAIPVRSRAVMTAEVLPSNVRPQRPVMADTDRVAVGPPVRPEVHNHIHVHLSGDPAADAEAVRAMTERAS